MSSAFSSDDLCPHCQTSRSVAPNLTLKYSTCCGLTLCTDCIQSKMFRGGSKSIPCPSGCGSLINEKSFASINLEAQRFGRESKLRGRLNRIFNAEPRDFPTEKAWNDYEEFVSEIIYDFTYGGKFDQDRAEKILEKYKNENLAEIEKRNRRKEIEEGRGENLRQEELMEDSNDLTPTVAVAVGGGPAMSFTLPQPKAANFSQSNSQSHSLFPTKEMEIELAAQPDSASKRAEIARRLEIRRLAKVAGGFSEEMVEKREREESMKFIHWLRLKKLENQL